MTNPHHRNFNWLLFVLVIGVIILFIITARDSLHITIQRSPLPLVGPQAVPLTINKTDPTFGNPGATHTLVIFGDLGDKNTLTALASSKKMVRQHPEDLQIIWKDLPRSSIFFFKGSEFIHEVAWCAGNQHKFWEFVDKLPVNGNTLNDAQLTTIATDLKLNTTVWWQCAHSTSTKEWVQNAAAEAHAFGATRAPLVFFNNHALNLDAGLSLENLLNTFLTNTSTNSAI